MLRGCEELPGVQTEAKRSELQVLLNQQQVTGQPPQCLHHQQGTTHTHARIESTSRWQLWHRNMHMYDTAHFCFPYIAGSRQAPAGCRHQSSSSRGFQRCGKRVCVFLVYTVCKWEQVQREFFSELICVLFCCRMTVSRLSFWRWQSSTLSQSSWFLSTVTFWSPSGRLAGPPAYQGEASAMRSTLQPVQVILVFSPIAVSSIWECNLGWGSGDSSL